MPDRNRTAIRIHLVCVVRQSQVAQDGQRLCRECLVELDYVELGVLQAGLFQQWAGWRGWSDSVVRGWYARRGRTYDAGDWIQSMLRRCIFRCEENGGCTVVDARRVARRD